MTTTPQARGWARRVAALLGVAAVLVLGPAPAQAADASAPPLACPPPLPPVPAQAAAVDRGLLWRLVRDGRTSWLYGTLHVGRPAWARLGPQVQAALRTADVLALEIDIPQETRQLSAQVREAAPVDPLAGWPQALQTRAEAALQRACVDRSVFAPLAPMAQLLTLSLLDARWVGLDALYGQEALLIRAAAQRQPRPLPLVGLETLAQQLAALLPSGAAAGSDEEARLLAGALDELESGRERRTMARLAETWARGDLEALADPTTWGESAATAEEQALQQRLNDARNPGLAAAIEARHARGERVFAAIGALHMTGPQAVTTLLAARGFQVQRVRFAAPSP